MEEKRRDGNKVYKVEQGWEGVGWKKETLHRMGNPSKRYMGRKEWKEGYRWGGESEGAGEQKKEEKKCNLRGRIG